jgi:hypothetical protein
MISDRSCPRFGNDRNGRDAAAMPVDVAAGEDRGASRDGAVSPSESPVRFELLSPIFLFVLELWAASAMERYCRRCSTGARSREA